MASALAEVYTISPPRTGDAVISRLVLTGWSNALHTWSEDGRMYWVVTAGDALELYRADGAAAGDLVASGTISSGVVTLSQGNSSGISGSARVSHTSGTAASGEIIVSYATEQDLEAVLHSATSLLSSSQWAGQTRFEEAFRAAKRELDSWLPGKVAAQSRVNSSYQFDRSVIASPRQLADVHAHLTAWKIMDRMASIEGRDSNAGEESRYHFGEARRKFGLIELDLDYDQDGSVDAVGDSSSLRLNWG